MTYDISPIITRVVPANAYGDGGAVAFVDVCFGPIMVKAKLFNGSSGYFLSWPSRKHEATGKWFDQVSIADPVLKMKATEKAKAIYEEMMAGQLID